MFPTLSGLTIMCGGDCGREGRKYKAPLSTRGKRKGLGQFPKLTSEILPRGKRALPPPGGPGLRLLLPWLLGASDRHWHLSGPQSPHQCNRGDFPGFRSVPAPPATHGGLSGSGAKTRQGALKARRLRNHQPSQGPTHFSSTQPGTRRPEGSQRGSPRVTPALIALATERKQRFTELKQLP